MVTVNHINCQIGQITFFELVGNRISKIFKFDNGNFARERKMSSALLQHYDLVPIKRCETEIEINMMSFSSPYIRCTQFPLTLAWAFTVQKIQELTIDVSVVGFELNKQKTFIQGQTYTVH